MTTVIIGIIIFWFLSCAIYGSRGDGISTGIELFFFTAFCSFIVCLMLIVNFIYVRAFPSEINVPPPIVVKIEKPKVKTEPSTLYRISKWWTENKLTPEQLKQKAEEEKKAELAAKETTIAEQNRLKTQAEKARLADLATKEKNRKIEESKPHRVLWKWLTTPLF